MSFEAGEEPAFIVVSDCLGWKNLFEELIPDQMAIAFNAEKEYSGFNFYRVYWPVRNCDFLNLIIWSGFSRNNVDHQEQRAGVGYLQGHTDQGYQTRTRFCHADICEG
jgi:hypothetical protein